MKVCTDACLFGAWVVAVMKARQIEPGPMLDIGTGTGLLSLMLAQEFDTSIDAVEIDAAAAQQAVENFTDSPWKERLHVLHTSLQQFIPGTKYGLIISNPPFFESDLRSANAAKNAAKHDTTLTLEELPGWMKKHLSEDGSGAILIPYHRTGFIQKLVGSEGLFITDMALVKQTPAHTHFRTMIIFSKKEKEIREEEMVIHDKERKYTGRFRELLRRYYLRLD